MKERGIEKDDNAKSFASSFRYHLTRSHLNVWSDDRVWEAGRLDAANLPIVGSWGTVACTLDGHGFFAEFE